MPGKKALVKPELLTWARERAKVKIEDAAKAVNVSPERMEQWELREEPQTFPLSATLKDDPEEVGQRIRDFLGVEDEAQKKGRARREGFRFLAAQTSQILGQDRRPLKAKRLVSPIDVLHETSKRSDDLH